MTKIVYVNEDLFTAPNNQLLCHAVNCQGIWGSGIAKEFRRRYPNEFVMYSSYCLRNLHEQHPSSLGQALITNRVCSLFTSRDYGANKDSVEQILHSTGWALYHLKVMTTMDLAMPKINSGLFHVPWEKTEEVIKKANLKQTVYVYELE